MQIKTLLLCIITGVGLISVNAASAAQSFPADLPTFSCEIKPLTREGLKTAKANRERFAKACLACIGDECAMRIWPTEYEDRETLCRNTYCLPSKVSRTAFSEGYNMSYRYNFRINADGSSEVLGGEYLDGEPRGVTGKKTKEKHQELLRKVISKVQYEPIIIAGSAKSLINLETVFEVGANYEE